MESSEFDKTIQQKLNENNSLHQKSILDSKANIWANIQLKSTNKTVVFSWYYSAVAALLLLFGCSILFYKMNQNYRNDLHVLSAQIHQLNNRPNQVEILEVKNKELDQLCAELEKKAQVLLGYQKDQKAHHWAQVHRPMVYSNVSSKPLNRS